MSLRDELLKLDGMDVKTMHDAHWAKINAEIDDAEEKGDVDSAVTLTACLGDYEGLSNLSDSIVESFEVIAAVPDDELTFADGYNLGVRMAFGALLELAEVIAIKEQFPDIPSY